MNEVLQQLMAFAPVETDRSFKDLTTLRIGGKIRYTIYPKDIIALDSVIGILEAAAMPYKIVGKGSDLLCSDRDYDGAVIKLDRFFNDSYVDGDRMVADAGCSIIALSIEAMKNGLSGLEFASGIPGTLGGALFMNAGAYRSSMQDVVEEVCVYHDRIVEWMSLEACEFSYRTSIFQKHPDWIILAAVMKLTPENPESISALMENRRERRMASQPLDKPSCGSVFRNPENENAWSLIDGIGYRGRQIGGARVSEKHCNFILNVGNANAEDYMELVEEIQAKVFEKYGIRLETEMEKFNW